MDEFKHENELGEALNCAGERWIKRDDIAALIQEEFWKARTPPVEQIEARLAECPETRHRAAELLQFIRAWGEYLTDEWMHLDTVDQDIATLLLSTCIGGGDHVLSDLLPDWQEAQLKRIEGDAETPADEVDVVDDLQILADFLNDAPAEVSEDN